MSATTAVVAVLLLVVVGGLVWLALLRTRGSVTTPRSGRYTRPCTPPGRRARRCGGAWMT